MNYAGEDWYVGNLGMIGGFRFREAIIRAAAAIVLQFYIEGEEIKGASLPTTTLFKSLIRD